MVPSPTALKQWWILLDKTFFRGGRLRWRELQVFFIYSVCSLRQCAEIPSFSLFYSVFRLDCQFDTLLLDSINQVYVNQKKYKSFANFEQDCSSFQAFWFSQSSLIRLVLNTIGWQVICFRSTRFSTACGRETSGNEEGEQLVVDFSGFGNINEQWRIEP